ncbi:hypothetical protein B0H11DRAFT_2184496 [Mycena galericulata]|nr:hypothetical protein B0H11DRAFT_2184496 [Mycena galericulata]
MATQSADNPALTRAQKRQNTIAEREENARQEQKAFEAEAKKTGGRQAKVVAKINAVWNVDNPKSRKRTSSTAQAPDNVKKARESVAQSDAEDDLVVSESEEAQAKGSKTKRKYPAPVIAINTDSDSEAPSTKSNKFPRLDLTKLPTTAKSKAAVSKVKQVAKKALSHHQKRRDLARPSQCPCKGPDPFRGVSRPVHSFQGSHKYQVKSMMPCEGFQG